MCILFFRCTNRSMDIRRGQRDGVLVLEVEGRIDTVTNAELQKEILASFQTETQVILDFARVEYISSAGLRALLIGQKTASAKQGKMAIVNVGEAIMKVLKMSGFDGILTIE